MQTWKRETNGSSLPPAETARAYGWEELPEDAGFKELALAMGNAFD